MQRKVSMARDEVGGDGTNLYFMDHIAFTETSLPEPSSSIPLFYEQV
jgi:hypothetical protein